MLRTSNCEHASCYSQRLTGAGALIVRGLLYAVCYEYAKHILKVWHNIKHLTHSIDAHLLQERATQITKIHLRIIVFVQVVKSKTWLSYDKLSWHLCTVYLVFIIYFLLFSIYCILPLMVTKDPRKVKPVSYCRRVKSDSNIYHPRSEGHRRIVSSSDRLCVCLCLFVCLFVNTIIHELLEISC